MAKLTLTDVSNLGGNPTSAQSTINTNSDRIEAAMENTLSRDGTSPNQMEADFDMNHYDILNAAEIHGDKLFIDGVPLEDLATKAQLANETTARIAADNTERNERIAGDKAVASLIGQSGAIEVPLYDTRLAVTFANIKPTINAIRTGGYSVAGDGGDALYKRVGSEPTHAGKIQSADGAWWELTGNVVRPETFGSIVYANRDARTKRVIDISTVDAVSNRDAIQNAYDYLSSKGGGVIDYIPGKIYSVSKNSTDTFSLVFDKNNIHHRGYGATLHRKYEKDNPFNLIRLGISPVTSQANGRTNLTGGGLYGLEIDGGCNVQLISNGKAFEGTSSWDVLGSAELTTVGGATQKRAFRLTINAAGSGRAFQAIPTEIGSTYYVLCEVGTGTDSNTWAVVASATNAASGQLAQANYSTSPDGFVRFEFTATGTTSYILFNLSSSTPIGGYREFRDVRVWEKSDQDETPLIWCSGLNTYKFEDLHIHDSRHYGIGLQNGGYENVKISNCVIEDTYMDGIDHKNNGSVSNGNSISNLTLRRNCLKSEPSNPAASLDLSEGWTITGLSVLEFGSSDGTGAGFRCKIGEIDSTVGRGYGGRRSAASAIKIEADLQCISSVSGIHLQNKACAISDFIVIGAGYGLYITDQQNVVSNGHIEAKTYGLIIQDKPASTSFPITYARRNKISNVSVSGAQTGVRVDGELNELIGVEANQNVLNFYNTGSGNRWVGGRIGAISGVTTQQVKNTQGNLTILNCYEFDTEISLITSSVPADTVGTSETYTIEHGLGYKPDVSDIQISLVRDTSASFAAIPVIISTNSTIVSWRLDTVTAGTAGTVVKAAIKIASQHVPTLS